MGGVIDPAEAYQRAAALFGETISALSDEEWELSSRPDDWTVQTTVAWVVVGDAQISAALEGAALRSVADFDVSVLGPNAVSTWRGTAIAAIGALREEGALVRRVEHPEGDLVVADLVGQRVSENLVRAHDIGVATGRAVELPDDLADWCLDFWAGHADAVMSGGVLPESPREPAPDASAGERLLALTGR